MRLRIKEDKKYYTGQLWRKRVINNRKRGEQNPKQNVQQTILDRVHWEIYVRCFQKCSFWLGCNSISTNFQSKSSNIDIYRGYDGNETQSILRHQQCMDPCSQHFSFQYFFTVKKSHIQRFETTTNKGRSWTRI